MQIELPTNGAMTGVRDEVVTLLRNARGDRISRDVFTDARNAPRRQELQPLIE